MGSSNKSRSGLDSSNRQRATRRRSPPERVVTAMSPGRQAQGVHGDLEGALEVPGAGGVDLVLQLGLFGEQCVEVGVRLAEGGADLVETVDEGLRRGDAVRDVAQHVLGRVELGLLGKEADGEAGGETRLAAEAVVDARHDLEQGGLARSVGADDPDLGPREEGEVDAPEDLPVGWVEAPEVAHRVDELGWHGLKCAVNRPRSARWPARAL